MPTASAATAEDIVVECGVCYTYKLARAGAAGQEATVSFPDVRCESDLCGRAYHASCLIEWLVAIPTTRKSFGQIFGHCPYCQSSISLSIV